MLEQELKFTVENRSVLDAVLASSLIKTLITGDPDPVAERFQGFYYDTPDWALERQKCSLRARREGDRFRAALKMPGRIVEGLSIREEYEADIFDWPRTVSEFSDAPFKNRLTALIPMGSKLVPRVEVDMLRRTAQLSLENSEVALMLDEGTIRGGDQSVSFCEVELELVRGAVEDVLDLGRQLEQQFFLMRSTLSKHEVGLQLWGKRYGDR